MNDIGIILEIKIVLREVLKVYNGDVNNLKIKVKIE